jgi:hypothetical protein
MGKRKLIGIGVGILLAVIIIGAGASGSQSHQSSQQSAQQASSSSSQNIIQSSNSPMTISVNNVIEDKVSAPQDHTTYIYDIDMLNNDNLRHSNSLGYFQLVTNTNSAYSTTVALSIRQPLQIVDLAPAQHDRGQIAFEIPNSEVPSKLEYINRVESIDTSVDNLPNPSTSVSSLIASEVNVEGDSSLPVSALAFDQCSCLYHYSGEPITIKISLNYNGISGINPESVRITSITNGDPGFQITNISPSLPITLDLNSRSVDVLVTLSSPSYSYHDDLHFNVNISK